MNFDAYQYFEKICSANKITSAFLIRFWDNFEQKNDNGT